MRRWRVWFNASSGGAWLKLGILLDLRYQVLTIHFWWWEASVGRVKPDWILTARDYKAKVESENLLLLRRKPN